MSVTFASQGVFTLTRDSGLSPEIVHFVMPTDPYVEGFAPGDWYIKGAKWVTFPNSSHMPHQEERAEYMKVVGGFLTE